MNDRHFSYITKSLKETLSEKHFLVFKKLARFNLSQGVVSLCDSAIVWYDELRISFTMKNCIWDELLG